MLRITSQELLVDGNVYGVCPVVLTACIKMRISRHETRALLARDTLAISTMYTAKAGRATTTAHTSAMGTMIVKYLQTYAYAKADGIR